MPLDLSLPLVGADRNVRFPYKCNIDITNKYNTRHPIS